MITTWRNAPLVVKWISLLWFVLGIAGIISGIYSWIIFISLPVSGMTGMVVTAVTIQVGIAAGIIVAVWKFLLHVSWGRVVLEIATWITLAYYVINSAIWIGAAAVNWNEFKASIATEVPWLSPELKLAAGAVFFTLFIVLSILVIKGLRSATVRQYVTNKQA